MKQLVTIFALLSTCSAFACPDFNGNYTCIESQSSDRYSLNIRQTDSSYTYTDDYQKETLHADGKIYKLKDSEDMINAQYVAVCEDDSVILNVEGEDLDIISGIFYPFSTYSVEKEIDENHFSATILFSYKGKTTRTDTICTKE